MMIFKSNRRHTTKPSPCLATYLACCHQQGDVSTLEGDTSLGSDPVAFVRGPAGRGMVVIGMASGGVLLVDPRSKLKVRVCRGMLKRRSSND